MKVIYRKEFKKYLIDLGKKNSFLGGGSVLSLISVLALSLLKKSIDFSKENFVDKFILKNIIKEIESKKKIIYPYIDKDGEYFHQLIKHKRTKRNYFINKIKNIMLEIAEVNYNFLKKTKAIDSFIKSKIKSDFYFSRELFFLCLKSALYYLEVNQKMFRENFDKEIKEITKKLNHFKETDFLKDN